MWTLTSLFSSFHFKRAHEYGLVDNRGIGSNPDLRNLCLTLTSRLKEQHCLFLQPRRYSFIFEKSLSQLAHRCSCFFLNSDRISKHAMSTYRGRDSPRTLYSYLALAVFIRSEHKFLPKEALAINFHFNNSKIAEGADYIGTLLSAEIEIVRLGTSFAICIDAGTKMTGTTVSQGTQVSSLNLRP